MNRVSAFHGLSYRWYILMLMVPTCAVCMIRKLRSVFESFISETIRAFYKRSHKQYLTDPA